MTDILLEEANINHPLSNDNIGRLIYLEDLFYKRAIDVTVLNDLCLIYAKLVEYYDLKRDPVKLYFLEKIQIVTSCKSTITMLGNVKDEKTRSPSDIDPSKMEVDRHVINNALKELSGKKKEYDYQSRKQVRAKNFDFTLKLDNEQKKKKINPFKDVVNDMNATKTLNDNAIKDNLKSQTDLIKAKLEKRKQNSFQRSMAKNQSMREMERRRGPMFKARSEKNMSIGGMSDGKNILGEDFLKEIQEARTPRETNFEENGDVKEG